MVLKIYFQINVFTPPLQSIHFRFLKVTQNLFLTVSDALPIYYIIVCDDLCCGLSFQSVIETNSRDHVC